MVCNGRRPATTVAAAAAAAAAVKAAADAVVSAGAVSADDTDKAAVGGVDPVAAARGVIRSQQRTKRGTIHPRAVIQAAFERGKGYPRRGRPPPAVSPR